MRSGGRAEVADQKGQEGGFRDAAKARLKKDANGASLSRQHPSK